MGTNHTLHPVVAKNESLNASKIAFEWGLTYLNCGTYFTVYINIYHVYTVRASSDLCVCVGEARWGGNKLSYLINLNWTQNAREQEMPIS